jgi:O-antigen/teichoic acid export membrane protein
MVKFKAIISFLLHGFKANNQRNFELFQNIVYSFFIKFGIAVIGLLLVPLNLEILNPTDYGVWLTVSSLTTWFYFFDIGLANGFRNRFTEAVAKNDTQTARIYLSTTYAIILLIVVVILFLFYLFNTFFNWNTIFNTSIDAHTLKNVVHITVFMLALKLVLSVLSTTLIAFHKIRISNLIELLGSISILLATLFAINFTNIGILGIALINTVLPILVLMIASILVYNTILKQFQPKLKFIQFSLASQLFNKGFQFFILQLAGMFMLVVNQILIARLFEPSSVTAYAIVSKYFSIPLLGFSIVIVPFWSSFSEAYHKQEMGWIQKSVRKLIITWFLSSIGVLGLIFLFPLVLKIWIQQPIDINFKMIVYFALFVVMSNWANLFNQFNNALDKLRIQLYCSMFMIVCHIPLSIHLCNAHQMGIEGVMLSACICMLPSTVFSAMQYYLIVQHKARGQWLK